MSPFIDMFDDHDILLFDFRGHGFIPFSLLNVETWPKSIAQLIPGFSINPKDITLGKEEDRDVIALVKAFKKRKQYEKVNGIGICYGAFILLKAASEYTGLFDKLILDGCWLSLPLFIEKVKKDVKTIFDPQRGGWAENSLLSKKCNLDKIEWLVVNILGLKLHAISLEDYVEKLTHTELLFFHGKNDLMIYRSEFETLWNKLGPVNKTAIITSNPHVRNHWNQKELYAQICTLFLSLEHEQFQDCLKSPTQLAHFYTRSIQNILC
jgi:pimeloyl-ACP methyl ester carboxylesterase